MGSDRRTYRVAQAIREQLAQRLYDSADERFHLVTITAVKVSKDLRQAKVYWVQSGDSGRIPDIEAAFQKAQGFFRSGLAEGLQLRFIPELRFYYDDTLDTVQEVEELVERARLKDDGEASHE